MAETVFEELKRYVRWDESDERALRELHGVAKPQFQRLAEVFYERILAHEGARTALVGGESQVGHLKVTMDAWLDQLLGGPWDEAYWEQRYRIGRVHVRIGLPQHYMFGAMNVHRTGLARIAYERFHADPRRARASAQRARRRSSTSSSPSCCTPTARTSSRSRRASSGSRPSGSSSARSATTCATRSASSRRRSTSSATRTGEDERAKKHLDRIGEQLGVANGIITNLLDMIRNRPLARERVALAAVLGGAARAR